MPTKIRLIYQLLHGIYCLVVNELNSKGQCDLCVVQLTRKNIKQQVGPLNPFLISCGNVLNWRLIVSSAGDKRDE